MVGELKSLVFGVRKGMGQQGTEVGIRRPISRLCSAPLEAHQLGSAQDGEMPRDGALRYSQGFYQG